MYGRSYEGNRCHDTVSNGHWEAVTVLSAMRLDGAMESIVFEGAVDRDIFNEYIKQFLAPTLKADDILIMDNLSVHKSSVCREVVLSRQAEIKFLPAYSPDFNPIEKMWSKVKQLLRGMKAQTTDELFTSVGLALNMVTADDAKGWFRSCGYIVPQY